MLRVALSVINTAIRLSLFVLQSREHLFLMTTLVLAFVIATHYGALMLVFVTIVILNCPSVVSVMLPSRVLAHLVVDVSVIRATIAIVVIYHHMVIAPVKTTKKETCTDMKTWAPMKPRVIGVMTRRAPINRLVDCPPPIAVHNAGVIKRHINGFTLNAVYHNFLLFSFNALILVVMQVALGIGTTA